MISSSTDQLVRQLFAAQLGAGDARSAARACKLSFPPRQLLAFEQEARRRWPELVEGDDDATAELASEVRTAWSATPAGGADEFTLGLGLVNLTRFLDLH